MGRKPKESTPDDGSNTVTPKSATTSSETGPKIEGGPTPISKRDDVAGVKVKYINLKVGEDGAFDLTKMRDKNKAELREAIGKTARKGELGGSVEIPETFTPESMLGYVSLLFGLEAQIVVKMKVADVETAKTVFSLDEKELKSVAVPAAKVANKYLADFKYADEMALIGAVTEMTFTKIMLCRAMMELKRADVTATRPDGHARPQQVAQ